MDSLRRSFKSHGSYRRSSSRTPSLDRDLEDQPILLDHQVDPHPATQPQPHPQPEPHPLPLPQPTSVAAGAPSAEVVVSVDGNATVSGAGDYDFWNKPTDNDDGDFSFPNQQQQQQQQQQPLPYHPHQHQHHHRRDTGGDGHRHHHHHKRRDEAPPPLPPVDDPPSRLISSFLNKQKAAGVEVSLDMDLEMEELKRPNSPMPAASSPLSASAGGSREIRVSFQDPSDGRIFRSRGNTSSSSSSSSSSASASSSDVDQKPASGGCARDPNGGAGAPPVNNAAEVLRCTSTAYRRASSLMRTKNKSRLMDPPPVRSSNLNAEMVRNDSRMSTVIREPTPGRSGILRSGILRSGILGKVTGQMTQQFNDEDDDDPFSGEDVPEDFHRQKLNFWVIVEWLSLVIIIGALGCSLYFRPLQKMTVWNLHLWKWEVLVLVLICGRLVSGWFIHLVVYFFERNFLLRKKVLYFVYGVRKAVQNCLWLGLVLLAWHYLFDRRVERETRSKTLPYVTKVFVCLLVTNFIRLVKTLLVKVLASSFHVSTYFDRIQESLFNQYVIETLSGPPVMEVALAMEEDERVLTEMQNLQNAGATITPDLRAAMQPTTKVDPVSGSRRFVAPRPSTGRPSVMGRKSVIFSGPVNKKDQSKLQDHDDGGITIDHLHKLNQKNVSAWNMKRLMNIVRHGALSTLDEKVTDASNQDESKMQILSEYEAKVAAKKIFNNVARPDVKHIYLVDLLRFLREDEALKTMSLFDGALEKKRVSKSALKNWLVNAFRERRALSLTLNDTKTAVKKLHQMVNVVVFIIVFIIWLLILEIATSHIFVLLSSQLLLAVFVFGNTCKLTFEAIIFLFVMHPFDVGDRCEIDEIQMVVEEMNIMTTIFLRYDGLKITYPNSLLATKTISNFYRSPDMGDSIDFCIHVSTPTEKINIMKEKIKGYLESKKEHWHPGAAVVLRDVEDMNRLKVSIWFQHRINHQDMGERWFRRELVVAEMIRVLKDLDIDYRMLPLEVNVRNMPAVTSSRLPSTWTVCS